MYVLYYASMLWCWHLVWILVRTNDPCLGWDITATSHRSRCLGLMLPETRVGRYLAVSMSPGRTEARISFLGGWIRPPGGEILPARA
jgi:hypothetical protein